ncbi:MAG: phosphopantetheine-binding protein, partial [Bacteroidota bacterium]
EEAGDGFLVAYLVTDGTLEATAVRGYLADKMPYYQVPSFFVWLDKIPLLANGKIDRKRLPEPENKITTEEEVLTEFEQLIYTAWTEVFAREYISRKTNFLDLGGHSLTGIRLMNRINTTFELELPANTIFRYPTIATLATHVEATIRDLLKKNDND